MFISKHHYAVALSKLGNDVFFLNSPDKSDSLSSGEIRIEASEYERLHIINHRLYYPYLIKHKAKWLHDLLFKHHVKNIYKSIGKQVDVIWSFDYSNALPLAAFPGNAYKIFMPVDEPQKPHGILAAKSADVILSVTNEILNKYDGYNVPKMFVNHGVSDVFIGTEEISATSEGLNVGLSGNFLRKDIDWATLYDIVSKHKDITFNFYGAFDKAGANLSDINMDHIDDYREKVKNATNTILHGIVGTSDLATGLNGMDAFLICYDIDRDHSSGTNYHKVMEYLATGKVIVSNNITTYSDRPDLVLMPEERNNQNLFALFSGVIAQVDEHNAMDKQAARRSYACEHTYANNIKRIEQFISDEQAAV